MAEWQRLTQLYREMGDGELEELDADKGDLTEVAQHVLRDEMRKRGLDKQDKPRAANGEASHAERFASPKWKSHGDWPEGEEEAEEGDEPVEYTWKTPLCEFDDREEAWQIQEVLRQVGIESWLEGPGYSIAPYSVATEMNNPQILVAADQLDQARAVLAKPIPQEIVEQSKSPIEEYVPPMCPSCGAEDPVLESADPVNSWRCEQCGRQWTEAEDEQCEGRPQ